MAPAKPSQRLIPRIAIEAVVCMMVLGLISAASVAWGIALAPRVSESGCVAGLVVDHAQPGRSANLQSITFSGIWRPGFTRFEFRATGSCRTFDRDTAFRAVSPLEFYDENWTGPADERPHEPTQRPPWSASHDLPPEDGSRYTVWAVRSAGWPCLCLCSRTTADSSSMKSTTGSLSLLGSSNYFGRLTSSDPERGTVPLIPLWPGLAIDSALYSAAWALLLFVPLLAYRRLRTSRRRRLGLCPACAYDTKGQDGPCPECGV
jgi:hypothetical protein